MIIKKRPVTLLELLIVITLLSIAAGVVGINIAGAIREQNFLGEVQQVSDQIKIAQDLMVVSGAEVKLAFTAEEKQITLQLECDDSLPDLTTKLLRRKTVLTHIRGVHFNSDAISWDKKLLFQSKGSVMSKGILHLEAGEKLNRYIPLSGYPAPIQIYEKVDTLANEEEKFDLLAQTTVEEINEEKKKPDPS